MNVHTCKGAAVAVIVTKGDLLGQPDDPAGRASPGVTSCLGELMAALDKIGVVVRMEGGHLAQVVLVGVDDHSPADDGVLPRQADHGVRDVHLESGGVVFGRVIVTNLGGAAGGLNIAQISGVPLTLTVSGCSVLTTVRVEVRPGTKYEEYEALLFIRQFTRVKRWTTTSLCQFAKQEAIAPF